MLMTSLCFVFVFVRSKHMDATSILAKQTNTCNSVVPIQYTFHYPPTTLVQVLSLHRVTRRCS